MDYYRKEMARLAMICYVVFWFCYAVLRINSFMPTGTLLSDLLIGLSLLGWFFSSMFFIGFLWEFGVESINYQHISSTWTWLMRFEFVQKFVNKFFVGNYVGFKRLCLLIIAAGIIVYAVPYFHSEGLMSLPAVSMFFSVVFIMKG